MNTLQTYLQTASQWVEDNSTDVVYIGLAVVALLLVTGGSGGKRRR